MPKETYKRTYRGEDYDPEFDARNYVPSNSKPKAMASRNNRREQHNAHRERTLPEREIPDMVVMEPFEQYKEKKQKKKSKKKRSDRDQKRKNAVNKVSEK